MSPFLTIVPLKIFDCVSGFCSTEAGRGSRHLVHESWGDNLYLERTIEGGNIVRVATREQAAVKPPDDETSS